MPDIRSHPALRPVKNAVSSFWFPFKGIWYFCANREYWPLWGRRLIPLTVTSIVILGLLFTFTYLPQVAFLAIFHGHLAWFNAAFLVLGEAQVVIALLFEALLVDETLVNVFDVRSDLIYTLPKLTFLGNPYPRRPHRSRVSLSNPRPRCSKRSENAGQAHLLCCVLPLFVPPDRRVHFLSPT